MQARTLMEATMGPADYALAALLERSRKAQPQDAVLYTSQDNLAAFRDKREQEEQQEKEKAEKKAQREAQRQHNMEEKQRKAAEKAAERQRKAEEQRKEQQKNQRAAAHAQLQEQQLHRQRELEEQRRQHQHQQQAQELQEQQHQQHQQQERAVVPQRRSRREAAAQGVARLVAQEWQEKRWQGKRRKGRRWQGLKEAVFDVGIVHNLVSVVLTSAGAPMTIIDISYESGVQTFALLTTCTPHVHEHAAACMHNV